MTKREQILAAALRLFAEQGFKGTSTAEIARSANVATGTLFHYFKTKNELISTLYTEIKGSMADALRNILADDIDVREKIMRIWKAYVSWAVDFPDEYRFIKHCDSSPYIAEQVRTECEAKFDFVFSVVQEAVELGLMKKTSVELLINLMMGAMDGFIRYRNLHPESLQDAALWEQTSSALWDMVR